MSESFHKHTGWTLETLKTLMDERDRRYGEVSSAKEEAVKVAFTVDDLASALKAKGTLTDQDIKQARIGKNDQP
jgi:hypothetical protein